MMKRKYRSEIALNIYGGYALLIQQNDFADMERQGVFRKFIENPCHIYMICRRPRISFDSAAFQLSPTEINGAMRIHIGEQLERLPFCMENSKDHPTVKIECVYPYTMVRFLDDTGGGIQVKAAVLAGKNHVLREHLALEVLYVGQSYGVDGARTAPERLRNHSTLQGIYAEATTASPDKEIWLLLWSFNWQWITSIDGRRHVQVATTDAEDDEHRAHVLGQLIDEQVQINLAEAALIRYFRPEYNKIYKDSFPNPAHITYKQCYALDLNTVNVEVSTNELASQLKSAARPPAWSHCATYPFHSPAEREAMFNIEWPS